MGGGGGGSYGISISDLGKYEQVAKDALKIGSGEGKRNVFISFALKLHALLCRPYVKGRDWFDFVWYVSRQTRPNLPLLCEALKQQGPWARQDVAVDSAWVRENMTVTIRRIDWTAARQDVQRFLPLREQNGLNAWGVDFFLHFLSRLAN